jgi:hypothetical protein
MHQVEANSESNGTDPMVPLLTGWLLGSVYTRGSETMKINKVTAEPPDAFVVEFASGLTLRVRVLEVAPFDAYNPWPPPPFAPETRTVTLYEVTLYESESPITKREVKLD